MKHLIATAAAATALVCVAAPVTASAEGYFSAGYTSYNGATNLGSITGRGSWKSASPFGVEGEVSVGIDEDDLGAKKIELSSAWAVYGTATVPFGDKAELFARVGYGAIDVKALGSDEGFHAGVGGQWFWDDANGVRGDYTYADTTTASEDHVDIFSISYVHRFK